MSIYTYSGLHPRDGTIPVHTFYSADGGKPVVAMKASIVIDGQTLQETRLEEVLFMLNAFQHFSITKIYRTKRDYDYAFLVENLDNDSVPAKLEHGNSVATSCTGVIIDHDPRKETYMVGCGPHVFTNVVSDFSCTNPSSEFPTVQVQTSNKSYSNICDYKVEITCMMDCIFKDLPSYTSCSTLHEQQCSPAAVMPLEPIEAAATKIPVRTPNHFTTEYLDSYKPSTSSDYSTRDVFVEQIATSSTEIPERTSNHLTTEYLDNCESSAASACSIRDKPLMKDAEADDNFSIHMSLEFETFKPTISRQEKRHQAALDKLTVTVGNKHTFKD